MNHSGWDANKRNGRAKGRRFSGFLFPNAAPRLSAEKEAELIALMRPPWAPVVQDEARNKLVMSHLKICTNVLKRTKVPDRYEQDFASHLLLEAVKAVGKYDGSHGAKLGTWIFRCLFFQARDYVRNHELIVHVPHRLRTPRFGKNAGVVIDEQAELATKSALFGELDDEEWTAKTAREYPVDQAADNAEQIARIVRSIDLLDDRDALILKASHGIGRAEESHRKISEWFGKSHSWLSWRYGKARDQLKAILEAS